MRRVLDGFNSNVHFLEREGIPQTPCLVLAVVDCLCSVDTEQGEVVGRTLVALLAGIPGRFTTEIPLESVQPFLNFRPLSDSLA